MSCKGRPDNKLRETVSEILPGAGDTVSRQCKLQITKCTLNSNTNASGTLMNTEKICYFSVFMIATKRKSRMPSDCEIEAGSKILLCATTFRRSIFVIIK